jgi:FADH2 O2-dependent halogenase
MPVAYRDRIQHRLARAAGPRWVMLPHAYGFVDPLFSTGIAWSLRAVERLGLCFESPEAGRLPGEAQLNRYAILLAREADQIDRMVAAAYEAMTHFDLFAAHAMIYFATVSFAEVRQRLVDDDGTHPAWSGFLGVGDPVLEPLPRASLRRLRHITGGQGDIGDSVQRRSFARWVGRAIAARNVGGFGDPSRSNLYPVDLELLIDRHALLGMTREQLIVRLPALRGVTIASGSRGDAEDAENARAVHRSACGHGVE